MPFTGDAVRLGRRLDTGRAAAIPDMPWSRAALDQYRQHCGSPGAASQNSIYPRPPETRPPTLIGTPTTPNSTPCRKSRRYAATAGIRGEIGGHAVFYLNGACRMAGLGYPDYAISLGRGRCCAHVPVRDGGDGGVPQ